MSSMRRVAELAGVSAATVSRVLNNHPSVRPAVRQRVLEVANQSRYVATVGKRSVGNIALLYTGPMSLGSPYDMALMEGIGQRLDDFGFDLMVLSANRSRQPEESLSQMFIRKGVRGALIRTTTGTREACKQIAIEGFPAVAIGERFEDDERLACVYADSIGSSAEGVEHLLGLGHRRVAVSINVEDDSDHADRVEGYRRALTAAGIEIDDRLILRTPANVAGGGQLLRRILAMGERPTAIFVADPMVAIGLINEAHARGVRVPEDLSVVGFDDLDTRHLAHPAVTSVCQDARAIGATATQLLRQIMEAQGTVVPSHQVLSTWFEVHGSTGPVKSR